MANLHLVSHTHWDREWYLTFQQFHIKLVHLVDGLLDLFAKDPDYCYFMLDGQTIVLDDYLQMRPERMEDLRNLIQAGRILIGPWYVLPDEFLVSPEALIRNLLQGDRTCRCFGAKMQVGYIPDPFGHIGQMPQILQGFGIDSACVARGLGDQPAELWWQGPDGSRVFMAYLRDSYDNAAGLLPEELDRFLTEVCRIGEKLLAHSALPREHGAALLMFGTDHMEPPQGTSKAIANASQRLDGDRLLHSTLAAYLEEIRTSLGDQIEHLPVVEGELRACSRRHLLPGVLSSRIWIKQRNNLCQTLLEKWAEPFSTWVDLLEAEHRSLVARPASLLSQAWRLLMENHPHDSICGCSIDQVHEEMRPRFDQVEQIGEEITRQSLETIAENIQTLASDDDVERISAIVVFNPTAGPRTDLVQATLELPVGTERFEISDETGQVIPHQFNGLGSRELINVALDRKGFREGLGMIHGGQVMGLGVVSIHWKQDANRLNIDVILSDIGEPDVAAWEHALAQAEKYLSDPAIDTYIVRARSAPTASVIFAAPEIPGYGYRSFWVRPVAASQPGEPLRLNPFIQLAMPIAARLSQLPEHARSWLKLPQKPPALPQKPSSKPPYQIENEYFVVSVSEKTGQAHLYDKRSGQIWTGLNRFVSGGERGDEYNYCPPEEDILVDRLQVRRIQIERGPVQQWIEIEGILQVPGELAPDRKRRSSWKTDLTIVTRLVLIRGVPRMDIQTEVDNTARDHRLRVHFPAPFTAREADFDGHFEIVRRKTGVPEFDSTWIEQPRPEQPQRAFITITNQKLGLMLANRGLPEVEAISKAEGGSEIALTLLRCTGWLSRDDFATRTGHAGPAFETPEAQMQGKHSFEYSVIPFKIDPEDDQCETYWEACRQAWAYHSPMRSLSAGIHSGQLPEKTSFIEIYTADFAISTIKTTEDCKGWIVRGYNPTPKPLQVKIKSRQDYSKVWKARLDETPVEKLEIDPEEGIVFNARPNEVVTIRLEQ